MILSELNVKNLELLSADSTFLKKKIKPNFKSIGPKYGRQMKAISSMVLSWGAEEILTVEKNGQIKSVYKRMSLYKCPLYDHSWSFFCHMCVYLSQNWGSDGHFEVLNRPYLWLVENLWCKTQIFPFIFFCDFVQKQIIASFLFFTFLCFLS